MMFKGCPIDLVRLQSNSKGFGEDFYRFLKGFLLIWSRFNQFLNDLARNLIAYEGLDKESN